MLVRLEMGADFPNTVAELSSMGRAVVEACSVGLKKGVKLSAARVT